MNILLVTWNFPPKVGGLENVIYNVWKRLNYFHPVYVITSHSKNRNAFPDDKIYRAPLATLYFYLIYAFIKGAIVIKIKKIDVLLAGSALTCPIAVVLGKLFNKKVITQVFGLDVIYPSGLYQFFISLFLPKNSRIIAISRSTETELIKRAVPAGKISIIHPGIDTDLFRKTYDREELKKKYGLKNKKILLSVCRLAKRKGIPEFINNSLPEIIKQCPDCLYLVVGNNPQESLTHKNNILEEIKTAIESNGLENYVRLRGNVTEQDLIELYYLCDLFVLPVLAVKNDMEGFGIVFIEANAAGRPVIGTKTGGIPDAVINGENGVIVEPGNYTALSREIINLLNNPQKMREMGNRGKMRAEKEFKWDIIIKDYLALFESILTLN